MYSIFFNNKEIRLPDYSFAIAEKLEETETINNSSRTFKEKCKAVYDFEKDLIKDAFSEIIGDFETCDPNDIQLLFMGIVECYNQPIIEKRRQQIEKTMNSYDFSKISKLVDSAEKLK